MCCIKIKRIKKKNYDDINRIKFSFFFLYFFNKQKKKKENKNKE